MNDIVNVDLECDNCGISESGNRIRLYYDKVSGCYICGDCKKLAKSYKSRKSDQDEQE